MNLTAIAQSLIVRLAAPAQFHSVWIRSEINDKGRATGKKQLCVSIRPPSKGGPPAGSINVPDEHQGVAVVRVPWPEDQI